MMFPPQLIIVLIIVLLLLLQVPFSGQGNGPEHTRCVPSSPQLPI